MRKYSSFAVPKNGMEKNSVVAEDKRIHKATDECLNSISFDPDRTLCEWHTFSRNVNPCWRPGSVLTRNEGYKDLLGVVDVML